MFAMVHTARNGDVDVAIYPSRERAEKSRRELAANRWKREFPDETPERLGVGSVADFFDLVARWKWGESCQIVEATVHV